MKQKSKRKPPASKRRRYIPIEIRREQEYLSSIRMESSMKQAQLIANRAVEKGLSYGQYVGRYEYGY